MFSIAPVLRFSNYPLARCQRTCRSSEYILVSLTTHSQDEDRMTKTHFSVLLVGLLLCLTAQAETINPGSGLPWKLKDHTLYLNATIQKISLISSRKARLMLSGIGQTPRSGGLAGLSGRPTYNHQVPLLLLHLPNGTSLPYPVVDSSYPPAQEPLKFQVGERVQVALRAGWKTPRVFPR
jgi:hypothetical protein